jgi:hypothetical protein
MDNTETDLQSDAAYYTRSQWYDYLQRFVPRENELIQYATDPTQPAQQAAKAQGLVDSAYTGIAGQQQRQATGLGLQLTPDQVAANQRQTDTSKSLSEVSAMNTAANSTYNEQMQILGGS